ncbi:MAG: polysaccharide deacetylase family protein [Magnetococcus sp. YQC-5]
MEKAVFILSFDCEGKWGVADQLTPKIEETFTTNRLISVYQKIIDILDKYELKSTFGFVASFILSQDLVASNRAWFSKDNWSDGGRWLEPFLRDFHKGRTDGWLCQEAFEMVRKQSIHEIGSHGFSHIPLSETNIDVDTFNHEMIHIRKVEHLYNYCSTTFIYPCNQVGYSDQLKNFGFLAFRPAALSELSRNQMMRGKRLISEWIPICPSHAHAEPHVPLALPPGILLNYRSGMRWLVPTSLTLKRINAYLDHAIKSGGVAHLYSHPHNFITGKNQFALLEGVCKLVSEKVRQGNLQIMTQHEYCMKFQ